MQIAVPVLLVIILAIVIVMVVLIIFQGEMNRKVEKLYKQIARLNSEITRNQRDKERRIAKNFNQIKPKHTSNSEYRCLQTEDQQEQVRKQIRKSSSLPEKIEKISKKIKKSKYSKEEFFGESIINKIGIVVLALGIAFFVKYAIESSWLNNAGRVFVGIFSSSLLVIISHFLHKQFRAFSSVLLGGAMAILYYTTAIAFNEYHLISEWAAFVFIFLITGFTVSLSIAYNRMELAFFATLAAFTAPLLVRLSLDSYSVLFSYLLIINFGILILVYYKKWLILNFISFYSTVIFIGVWFILMYLREKPLPNFETFFFITAFYVLFVTMHIIYNIKSKQKFLSFQLSMIVISNISYYSGALILIKFSFSDYNGFFTALMGVINFIYFLLLYRKKNIDVNVLNLFLGLVILFAALVPPVQLIGKTITLVWSIQMVLILWLSQKDNFNIMRLSSLGFLILMLISLSMDLWKIYINASALSNPMPVLINKGFVISFVASLMLGLYAYGLEKWQKEKFVFISKKLLKSIILALMAIGFYLTFLLEIRYQLLQRVDYENSIKIYLGIYNFAFLSLASIPTLISSRWKMNILSWYVGFLAFFIYVFYYHSIFIDVRNSFLLQSGAESLAYNAHFIIIFILLIIIFISLRAAVVCKRIKSFLAIFSLWASVATLLYVFSSELDNIYLTHQFRNGFLISYYITKVHAMPYTLLWGSFAFLLISLGMFIELQSIRNISLVLFFIIVLKMFLFDISRIGKTDQIIEYIFIGIVLLISSFMYHKSKYTHYN
jgi:uncharacterized membrane protein